MSRQVQWMIAATAAIALACGCKTEDDEYAPAVVPKTFVFEGKLDPKYVGEWASADGSSSLDIEKDGTLKISTTTRSVAGKNTSHVSGQWLVSGDSLMFQYVVGNQSPTVLKYAAVLAGTKLTLQLDAAGVKTAYKRK